MRPLAVVFLCTHNAGRSQMAAAFLERDAPDGVAVRSGGSAPAPAVNPVVVEAMREVGLDIGGRVPKGFDDDDVRAADVVVTMGCGDSCPVVPGVVYEDWALDDPAGRDLATVRRIRDEIETRVRDLIERRLTPRAADARNVLGEEQRGENDVQDPRP